MLKRSDFCKCGHKYSDHRMLCDCPEIETDCDHAVAEWDTTCFHKTKENYSDCDCSRYEKANKSTVINGR